MEEDGAVKAPVTRLRRRLSVEQSEDTKSPSTPSTPTKKKGRLAAKPQLQLIKENTPQNSPAKRTTKKSVSRDVAELPEEKVLTPSRRSARIKSNTSILSDSIPNIAVDSPRATRAARRYSQTGSDNEVPTTPARVSRRTRKDSTSSMDKTTVAPSIDTPKTPARTRRTRKDSATSTDKQGDNDISSTQTLEEPLPSKNIINEVIVEEPESELRKSMSSDITESRSSLNVSPIRKSPRLQAKGKGKTGDSKNDSIDTISQDSEVVEKDAKKSHEHNDHSKNEDDKDVVDGKEDDIQNELSLSCRVLLNELDNEIIKKAANLNKTVPSAAQKDNFKSKRQRTKSWTTLVTPNKNEENFYSDNESVKKKLKKHEKVFNIIPGKTGSGDCKTTEEGKLLNESSGKNDKEIKSADTSTESNKENLTVHDSNVTELLFQKAPSEDIQTMVFIEDSDTDSIGKQRKVLADTEDQCVPTVPVVSEEQNKSLRISDINLNKHEENQVINIFASNTGNVNDDTCEPMDIDETMPENVTLNDSTEGSLRKSSLCITKEDNNMEIANNKSKRKSSITNQDTEGTTKNRTTLKPKEINTSINEKINKSKRKSSITNQSTQEVATAISSVTQIEEKSGNNSRTSSLSISDTDVSKNERLNKSKRKSSASNEISKDLEKSQRKSSISNAPQEEHVKSGKKSRTSSLNVSEVEDSQNEKLDKSKRRSSYVNQLKEDLENSQKTSNDKNDEKKSRNSSLSIDGEISSHEKSNKSKRKSSNANITSQNIETKSMLVLSQIKDSSSCVPSPKSNLSELSKSCSTPKIGKNIPMNHNLSLSCLTSTPVQEKDLKKSLKPMNTSTITSKNKKEVIKNQNLSRNSEHEKDDPSDSDSTMSDDEESSQDKSNMLDDEAEEASDNYESGDSQIEEERQYAKDHEIVDKGVTLTSEEEVSDDTDYEKDSFVVSSDEEDNELLSGSEDDLNLSDNELTMSAKSKKKFDERMRKKQKKASKEMYEARHGSKSEKSRLDSTRESETEIMAPPKKNKRMRLDSNWDSSVDDESEQKKQANIPTNGEIGNKKKAKSKRLSESMSENNIEEENNVPNSSKTNDSTISEIGRKKKTKSKKLSESVNETTEVDLDGIESNVSNNSFSKVDISSKTKKDKKLSNSECDNINKENESESQGTLKKKKKPKRISESVWGTTEVANESQMEVTQDNPIEGGTLKKNKKNRKISDSVYNESVMSEKEMTVCNNSVMDKEDPLSIRLKQEPKTPQQSFNISTVNFTTIEEIEEVKVDDNISVLKANETSDPLQENDSEDNSDVSSISENEDTMKEYEAVLNQLNKENNKIKTQDISLNLDKKTKKVKNPVIEQLNITLIKNKEQPIVTKKNKVNFAVDKVQQSDDDASSDSIDLKLLFSEESNDSNSSLKNKTENEVEETFIPLKRTQGKTNIILSLNGSEAEHDMNTSVTNSAKKKSRKSSRNEDISNSNEFEENVFFVDTVGARANASIQSPKKKDVTPHKDSTKAELTSDESDDEPLEVTYSKTENEKQVAITEVQPSSPAKQGKKKKLSVYLSVEKPEVSSLPQNLSLDSSNLKKKNEVSNSVSALVNKNITKTDDKKGLKRKREPSPVHVKLTTETSQKEHQIKKQKISQNIKDAAKQLIVKEDVTKKIQDQVDILKNDSKKCIKRKHREDDEEIKPKVPVSRLPASIISQLEDKPKKEILEAKKARVVSTTEFIVQENVPKRIKPSKYLEESVYLNDDSDSPPKKKTNLKKPKVLPFVPTVSTSDSGFTTKFQVNVLPQKMEFVAKDDTTTDFKTNYLRDRRMKKLRTYEILKQSRNIRLTKY